MAAARSLVNYRPRLEGQALLQMAGLPAAAFDALTQTLARICADPYDRLFSRPIRTGDPSERMAELGDSGLIGFTVDDAEGLVHVYALLRFG